jgi:putative nucleotidyltransferase with HDIG domain
MATPMASVLIVDDDALILELLSGMLRRAGFETTCHSRPLDALSVVERDQPDVIIADLVMPEVNGIAFLEMSITRSPASARILCTAHTDSDVVMQAVNAGQVNRIIPKPPREVELVSAVAQAADTVALRRRNEVLAETLRRQNLHLEEIVRERTEALLQGFVASLDARDSSTKTHSQRVAKYARRLAVELGIAEPELGVIERGSLLHDIGKIGVPDRILLKDGPLSADEWEKMREHPRRGWALLQGVDYLRVASSIVLQHHERWDGEGYPSRIARDGIAIGARVFQVVDAYDAITTDRPYHRAKSHDQACAEITRATGTQFDPRVVDAFLAVPVREWVQIGLAVDRAALQADPGHPVETGAFPAVTPSS